MGITFDRQSADRISKTVRRVEQMPRTYYSGRVSTPLPPVSDAGVGGGVPVLVNAFHTSDPTEFYTGDAYADGISNTATDEDIIIRVMGVTTDDSYFGEYLLGSPIRQNITSLGGDVTVYEAQAAPVEFDYRVGVVTEIDLDNGKCKVAGDDTWYTIV